MESAVKMISLPTDSELLELVQHKLKRLSKGDQQILALTHRHKGDLIHVGLVVAEYCDYTLVTTFGAADAKTLNKLTKEELWHIRTEGG